MVWLTINQHSTLAKEWLPDITSAETQLERDASGEIQSGATLLMVKKTTACLRILNSLILSPAIYIEDIKQEPSQGVYARIGAFNLHKSTASVLKS